MILFSSFSSVLFNPTYFRSVSFCFSCVQLVNFIWNQNEKVVTNWEIKTNLDLFVNLIFRRRLTLTKTKVVQIEKRQKYFLFTIKIYVQYCYIRLSFALCDHKNWLDLRNSLPFMSYNHFKFFEIITKGLSHHLPRVSTFC
jgi:hypothetical protein